MRILRLGLIGSFCLGLLLASCTKDADSLPADNDANLTQEVP